MESRKDPTEMNSPCWKKRKEAEAGFLANTKDHLQQFANASMAQHRICLKKTLGGMGDNLKLRKQDKAFSPAKNTEVDRILHSLSSNLDREASSSPEI